VYRTGVICGGAGVLGGIVQEGADILHTVRPPPVPTGRMIPRRPRCRRPAVSRKSAKILGPSDSISHATSQLHTAPHRLSPRPQPTRSWRIINFRGFVTCLDEIALSWRTPIYLNSIATHSIVNVTRLL